MRRARTEELTSSAPSDPKYQTQRNERYANDIEHRKRVLTKNQQRYASDPEYRKWRLDRASDPEYCERVRATNTKWNNVAANAMKALQRLYQSGIPAIADA